MGKRIAVVSVLGIVSRIVVPHGAKRDVRLYSGSEQSTRASGSGKSKRHERRKEMVADKKVKRQERGSWTIHNDMYHSVLRHG